MTQSGCLRNLAWGEDHVGIVSYRHGTANVVEPNLL